MLRRERKIPSTFLRAGVCCVPLSFCDGVHALPFLGMQSRVTNVVDWKMKKSRKKCSFFLSFLFFSFFGAVFVFWCTSTTYVFFPFLFHAKGGKRLTCFTLRGSYGFRERCAVQYRPCFQNTMTPNSREPTSGRRFMLVVERGAQGWIIFFSIFGKAFFSRFLFLLLYC